MKNVGKNRRGLWRWAALACAGIFLFSCVMLVREGVLYAREREANRLLARQVQKEREASDITDADTEAASVPRFAPSGNLLIYDGLWQENHDLAGWLSIEDLGIDLPVMYTPSDPDYYLHRAFDGDDARSGSLFLGEGWEPESGYGIIYGHHMKDGSMFGRLERYRSLEYALEHPTIRFDTLTQEREYTVLAAFYSQANDTPQTDTLRYYQYTGLPDQDTFEEYLRQVRAAALYDTGGETEYGDRLLVLSTCSYHRKKGRFVVVAYQKCGA